MTAIPDKTGGGNGGRNGLLAFEGKGEATGGQDEVGVVGRESEV